MSSNTKLALCSLLLLSPITEAQESFPEAFDDNLMLWGEEETIYTATKFNKRLDQVPAIATVITAQQIQDIGARHLLDALSLVPGLSTGMTSTWGIHGVEVRGIQTMHSDKVLLLLDGHAFNKINAGDFTHTFQFMPLENVKRIEVIRGPASALYGSSAVVAVINVVTKSAEDMSTVEAAASLDSNGGQTLDALGHYRWNNAKLSTYLHNTRSPGAQTYVEADTIGRSGYVDDRHEQFNINLKLEAGNWTLAGGFTEINRGGYFGIAGFLNDETWVYEKHWFADARYLRPLNDSVTLSGRLFYDYYHPDRFFEIIPESIHPLFPNGMLGSPSGKLRTTGGELQLDTSQWQQHTLTFGLSAQHDKLYEPVSLSNFDPTSTPPNQPLAGGFQDRSEVANYTIAKTRDISAIYVQDLWSITSSVEATLGARYDYYSDFGGTLSPKAALVWSSSEDTTYRLIYGEAFRAPNHGELYTTNNPVSEGNPDLNPENIVSTEFNVTHQLNQTWSGSATYFDMQLSNLIRTENAQYENLDKASTHGLELELTWHASHRQYAYLNYTYQQPEDNATGESLPFVPQNKAVLGFNTPLGKSLNVNAQVIAQGDRQREADDTREELPGYGIVNLTVSSYDWFKHVDFQMGVRNLGDKQYANAAALNAQKNPLVQSDLINPGRSVFFELRYSR